MSYREYYAWCPQNEPATPPPPEQQITDRGFTNWSPQPSCTYSLRPAGEGETAPATYSQIYNQGQYLRSTPEEAARMQDWYRCDIHPNARLEILRQRAAYDRRFDRVMGYNRFPEGYTEHYIIQTFGEEIPWPAHVPEDRRRPGRIAYFPQRPRARSTASLWA